MQKNKQPANRIRRPLLRAARDSLGRIWWIICWKGHKVVAIDNFVTGSVDNIAHLAGNQNFKFIEQDVTEFLFLDSRWITSGISLRQPARWIIWNCRSKH